MIEVQVPHLERPPSGLSTDCNRPKTIPERSLTQQDVELFWGVDRKNLLTCRQRLSALAKYYHDRDAAIQKVSP